MTTLGPEQHDIAECREEPIGHCVFRQEAEPAGDADGNPPARSAVFARPDEGVECGGPEQQQWRIGRDDEGGDRGTRQARIGEGRPQPDPAVVEPGADRIDEDRGAGMQQRCRQPDREFAVAEEAGRQRDQPSDERRLRVVAKCRMLRPEPVLRLVRVEVGRLEGEPQQPQ